MAAKQQGFEQVRIKKLQDERESTQKKTFTKWMNSFLDKVRNLIKGAETHCGCLIIMHEQCSVCAAACFGQSHASAARLYLVYAFVQSKKQYANYLNVGL